MNPRRGARSGMTLLELLTVIVLVAILMGLTIYFVQGMGSDLGVDAAANQVASQLRGVHQMSRSNAIPGWVRIDFRQNSVAMLVGETVGEWHFEEKDPEEGAFNKPAKVANAQTVPGRIGHGVLVSGSTGIACGPVDVYTPDQGFAIEFWFMRKRGRASGVLCSVGSLIEISMKGSGKLEAKVGGVTLTSGQAALPDDTWCLVQLIHSGREARFLLNKAQVDQEEGRMYWTRPEPLVIGGRSGARGVIDEFRMSLIVPREAYYLPADTKFTLPGPDPAGPPAPPPESGELMIAFDGEGRLDASVQNGQVTVWIETGKERKAVEVGLGGNVRTFDLDPPAGTATPKAPAAKKKTPTKKARP